MHPSFKDIEMWENMHLKITIPNIKYIYMEISSYTWKRHLKISKRLIYDHLSVNTVPLFLVLFQSQVCIWLRELLLLWHQQPHKFP